MPTVSTSSSPGPDEVRRVPLALIEPHPANPNVMAEAQLETLERQINRNGRYPPLTVRPHPEREGAYQLLDGAQRLRVLERCGHDEALVYVWPCDDATALLLLATLNRLHGEDLPALRARLLAELDALLPRELLASLLPEDASQLDLTLADAALDPERLLAELTAAAERETTPGPRVVTFAVERDDEPLIEAALERAVAGLDGRNRRGRALALICARYLGREHHDA